MKGLKIRKTKKDISSSDDVRLYAPSSWAELTQDQLKYLVGLLVLFPNDHERIKTYLFVRTCGLTVMGRSSDGWKFMYKPKGEDKKRIFYMPSVLVTAAVQNFDFIDSYENMNTRVDSVCGLKAVDMYLHGIAFIDYLNAEKAFNGYLISNNSVALKRLLSILYRKDDGSMADDIRPNDAELLSTFLWYAFVIKPALREAFHNLFRPAAKSDSSEFNVIDSINAQIRALTGGDITKEKEVLHMDCWRALTELDAKSREAKEMQRIMDRNRKNA